MLEKQNLNPLFLEKFQLIVIKALRVFLPVKLGLCKDFLLIYFSLCSCAVEFGPAREILLVYFRQD